MGRNESHNRIPELTAANNKGLPKAKRLLIIGIRKTHKYVETTRFPTGWYHIILGLPGDVSILLFGV